MKNFILKFSIFIVPILLVLILVNYFGDSANLFKIGYELKMAEIIRKAKNVTNIDNYDERVFQKEIINQMKTKPNTIVLGASRSMFINKELTNDSSFFNNSVSGASLEDFIAIYQIYKEKKIIPKKVIIDIEPYMFNKNHGQKRWKSIEEYYYHFTNINNKKNKLLGITNKYEELFSLSYFQSSLKKIPNLVLGNNEPIPVDEKSNRSSTKLTDGSLVYGAAFRSASKSEVENKVKSLLSGGLDGFGNFKTIDNEIWFEFEKLIFDMRSNNIEIVFFLCPYHPEVYNRIKYNYPIVLKCESIINKFAKEKEIKLFGSYDPSKYGFDHSYFYDGLHCKEKGIEKIIQFRD